MLIRCNYGNQQFFDSIAQAKDCQNIKAKLPIATKDIPKNVVAVGIPARIVQDTENKANSFRPYAVGKDETDPMVKSIQSLIKQINKQEKMISDLENSLAELSKNK